jgi:hypothetical protein
MKTVAAKRGGKSGWRAIALILLLAFSLQSYITQTHFHDGAPGEAGLVKSLIAGATAPLHSRLPGDNPVDCPFCQAVANAGAYAMPVTLFLFLALVFSEYAAAPMTNRARADIAAHNWRSRAPPRH